MCRLSWNLTASNSWNPLEMYARTGIVLPLTYSEMTCLWCVSVRFIKVCNIAKWLLGHDTSGIVSPLTSSLLILPFRHFPVLEFETLHPGHLPAENLQTLKYKQNSKHVLLPLWTVVWTYQRWDVDLVLPPAGRRVVTSISPLKATKLQTVRTETYSNTANTL